MKDLIIQDNTTKTNSVDARELHKALEVKKAFTTWIKSSLDSAGAIEDEDYQVLKSSLEGSGYKKVYILTVDMAKHIAMMSKVPKAKEVRDHFIEAEKKLMQLQQVALPKNALREIKLALQGVVELDERLDTHHDRIEVLERTKRLENWQEKSLMDAHHRKVYEIAALYKSDREDKKLISSLHRKIWQVFKRHFKLTRYNELKAIDFEDGMTFINNLSIGDMV